MTVKEITLPKIDESVQYALENGLWLNATDVAKRHNKRLDKYFSNLETIQYMERLRVLTPTKMGELKLSKEGRYGGTYIHESLVIHFARWINIDFAIACDMFMKNTIKTQSFNAGREQAILELKAPKAQKDK